MDGFDSTSRNTTTRMAKRIRLNHETVYFLESVTKFKPMGEITKSEQITKSA